MEEEKVFEEQPAGVETAKDAEDTNGSLKSEQMPASDEEAVASEAERGVPIGKFKSVKDLYDAYTNLQAEFTRKSQRLSILEKDKMSETTSQAKDEENLKTFLSKNQEAILYAEELKSRAEQNESLKDDEKKFDKVWAEILYEKLSAPNKANDPLVQNLILKDENLKNLVIKDYMDKLQTQNTPIVMSSGGGQTLTKVASQKPDSFEQAKEVVLNLLS